jgi:FAD-dependent urate hydroxylase
LEAKRDVRYIVGDEGCSLALPLDVAVVGAGPYGLSIAAHLPSRRVQVFGEPMRTWKRLMPPDMTMRSTWERSNLSDPDQRGRLVDWAAETGRGRVEPLPLRLFLEYSEWFRERFVREVDEASVLEIAMAKTGSFHLTTSGGDELDANRIVVAVGVTPFPILPDALRQVPKDRLSFAVERQEFSPLSGQRVLLVGAGQTGLESAALAMDAGAASVEVVARRAVRWHPDRRRLFNWLPRPLATRAWKLAYPIEGAGPPGINLFALHPAAFRRIPAWVQRPMARRMSPPGGSPWIRDAVEGRAAVTEGVEVVGAKGGSSEGVVVVSLSDGTTREVDHVVAACGYRFSVDDLQFLSPEIRASIRSRHGFPVIDDSFRSTSNPRVTFLGYAAEQTFGPVVRSLDGTRFTCLRAARVL